MILCMITALTIKAYVFFLHTTDVAQPKLSAEIRRAAIRVGTLDRTYGFYVPGNLPDKAPLVFVLHGSYQDSEDIRKFTAYEFERIADAGVFLEKPLINLYDRFELFRLKTTALSNVTAGAVILAKARA